MSPTRLPRPGEVLEHCRLCSAVFEVSVENPRRVCATCGEVNLPNDQQPVTSAPAPASVRTGTKPQEAILFAVGAAPLPLATALATVAAYLVPVSKSLDAWVQVAFAVGVPALVVSFAVGTWLASRPKSRPLVALALWVLGLAVSGPLCTLVLALMVAVLGSLHR